MKICWLTAGAAPYTIKLLDEIGKKIDLCVVLNDVKEENRNSEWSVNNSYSFELYVIDNDYKKRIKEYADSCDLLVDGNYLSSYGYYAVSEFKKRNKKTILTADGGIPRNRGYLINKFMSYLMNRHDHFLSSSTITDRYFKYYGVDLSKVYHYKFTSLTNDDIVSNKKQREKKQEYRNKLGMSDRFVLLSVGRPIKIKGFDILLDAYIKSGLTDKIDLYIVGGYPQKNIEKIVEENHLENVHFVGLISKEELNEYYAAADALIMCSRGDVWGLVINEALSFGLPIISSDMCMASLHFADICNNPIICPLTDIDKYADVLNKIYSDSDMRKQLELNAFSVVKDYSIENSMDDIINVLSLL